MQGKKGAEKASGVKICVCRVRGAVLGAKK